MEINVTKKDLFNGKNSADKAENHLNEELEIIGIFDYHDDVVNKETGEVNDARLVCLVTNKGCISSPSKTLCDSVDKLVESFGDEVVGLLVKIVDSKSNAGRTFFRLELV